MDVDRYKVTSCVRRLWYLTEALLSNAWRFFLLEHVPLDPAEGMLVLVGASEPVEVVLIAYLATLVEVAESVVIGVELVEDVVDVAEPVPIPEPDVVAVETEPVPSADE